jgi:hypothetical protein
LVEVLISTLLFAVALLSLPQLFAIAAGANRAAGHATAATLLAAQKIEELRSAPFPGSLAAHGVEFLDTRGEQVEPFGSIPVYTRSWWIEPLPSAKGETMAIAVVISAYRRADDRTAASTGPELARVVTLRGRKAP